MWQAAALLESLGGARFLPADGMVYRFVTGAARDEALDLVRRRFGWTVAIPRDDGPGFWEDVPGMPRRALAGMTSRGDVRCSPDRPRLVDALVPAA